MDKEIYADGIGEIHVTGPIVRVDLVSLSPTERDEMGNPKAVFRQRIVMSLEAFAGSVDLMQKVLASLVESGAVRRSPGAEDQEPMQAHTATPLRPKGSPNFS
jgi:hypothetical protein